MNVRMPQAIDYFAHLHAFLQTAVERGVPMREILAAAGYEGVPLEIVLSGRDMPLHTALRLQRAAIECLERAEVDQLQPSADETVVVRALDDPRRPA